MNRDLVIEGLSHSPPTDGGGGNNVETTGIATFLHRLRQMPPQKQQQLVTSSAAIVRSAGNSLAVGNPIAINKIQTEDETRERSFEIIYGGITKEKEHTKTVEIKSGMCFVVDPQSRSVRIVGKDELQNQHSKLVHLEDIPDEEVVRFGRIFPEERIENTDRFVHCDSCNQYYDFCCLEHPFYQCQDRDPALSAPNSPSKEGDDRAALTLPGFLYIHNSYIPNAGRGVFTKVDIPVGIVFGPYEGILLKDVKKVSQEGYAWELRNGNGKPSFYIDAKDSRYSNWMRYINSPRHESEQNLLAFQYRGSVFYRVYRPIDKNSELLVRKELWQRTRHHKHPLHA